MEFGVDTDQGSRVSAWVLPDNPAQIPRLIVELDGVRHLVEASVTFPNLVAEGRSNTGICGFVMTDETLPGLSAARAMTLTEEDSNLTLYARRQDRPYFDAKLFLLETRPPEASACVNLFARAFQLTFAGMERWAQQTRKAAIDNVPGGATSILFGGQLCLRAHEAYLRPKNYLLTALLADPAELLFGALLPPAQAAAPDALARLERAVAAARPEMLAPLADPLTRYLCSLHFEDEMGRDAIAQALASLSDLDAVGVETAFPDFVALVAILCDGDASLLPPVQAHAPFALGEAMRRAPFVLKLIGRDLEVYDAVADAILESQRSEASSGAAP